MKRKLKKIIGDIKPSPGVRRTLTLITKLIQNLANRKLFGDKESFMTCTNEFLKSLFSPMEKFLNELITDPLHPEESWKDLLSLSQTQGTT